MVIGGFKWAGLNGRISDGWVQMGGLGYRWVQMGKFNDEWVLIDGLGGGWVGLAALGLCFFVLIFLIKGKESFNLF